MSTSEHQRMRWSACATHLVQRVIYWAERIADSRCAVLLFAIFCIALYSWRPSLSLDSVHYLDIARTMATEGQAATYHLLPTSQRIPDTSLFWPPGYPWALSLLMRLGLSNDMAAFGMSTISYAALVVLLVCVLRRQKWMLLGVILWLWLIYDLGVIKFAWSEGPFMSLVAGAVVVWGLALRASWPRALALASLAGALAGTAALTRYLGLALVPAFVVSGVLVRTLARADRSHSRNAVLWGLWAATVAVAVFGLWVWRNYAVNGTLLGPERAPGQYTYVHSLARLVWYLSRHGLAMLLPLLIALTGADPNEVPANGANGLDVRRLSLSSSSVLACVWSIIYTVLLVWQEAQVQIDAVNGRLLFPAFAGILLAGLLYGEATRHLRTAQLRQLRFVALAVAPLLLVPGLRELSDVGSTTKNARGSPVPMSMFATDTIIDWVCRNTPRDSLLIGERLDLLRYKTGRVELSSRNYYLQQNRTLNSRMVLIFLHRHGGRFRNVYIVVANGDLPHVRVSFAEAGILLEPLYSERHNCDDGVSILQIKSWP
jgi:hypothetical protein